MISIPQLLLLNIPYKKQQQKDFELYPSTPMVGANQLKVEGLLKNLKINRKKVISLWEQPWQNKGN